MNARNTIRTALFAVVLFTVFCLWNRVLCLKSPHGIYTLWAYYRQKRNTVDVLFIGSSHIYVNVSTGVLWREYGIAGFDLAASTQPMWSNYYYLKEGLKTQKPRLVVLDLVGVVLGEGDFNKSNATVNNFGLRLSLDKVHSIMESFPREAWKAYFLGFPVYHTRYTELTTLDFFPSRGTKECETMSYNYWKGHTAYSSRTSGNGRPVGFETDEIGVITPVAEEYLRKICALCLQRGIPLLLIKTPYQTNSYHTAKYNRAAQIAGEYGYHTVNFNYLIDDIGLDFDKHYRDGVHLNIHGDVIFTRYLARYIKTKCVYGVDIPDRRGQRRYASYNLMAEAEKKRVQTLEETGE